MSKHIIYFIIYYFLIVSTAHARPKPPVTKQLVGQSYYLKRCSSCHGAGNRGGNLYSVREWRNMFSRSAKTLKKLHEDEDGGLKVIKYLESNNFKKEKRKMLKFIQEFAYDSDTIPTCN